MPATLYLVSTPIGNLEDITLRALRILRDEVAIIACEDTRQTQKLLEHYQIRKPLLSYHEHNEASRAADLIQALERGESVALVSDAGTPLLSDPGYRVVIAAIEKEIPVVPIPGASAVLAALAASGLPTGRVPLHWLPAAQSWSAPHRPPSGIVNESITVVAYESPHRILETLAAMAEVFGDRRIVLARELTKIHEEFLRGSAESIRQQLAQRPAIKGEITLLIRGCEELAKIDDPVAEVARLRNEAGLDRMEAIKIVAKQMGLPKREVYRLFAAQGSNPPDKHRD